MTIWLFVGKQYHRLNMHRRRKHIHTSPSLNFIPGLPKDFQIPRQARRLTADINHFLHPKVNDLLNCFRMYPIPGRVQHNKVRLVFQLIDHLQHIPCDKFTVIKPIETGIFPGSLHGFFDDLHTDHLLCHRRQHLGNGPGSAVQVKDDLVLRLSYILPGSLIQHFRPQSISLEERKRRNLKFQPKDFLIEKVLPVNCLYPVCLHHIGQTVVHRMQNPPDAAVKGQREHLLCQRLHIHISLGSCDDID